MASLLTTLNEDLKSAMRAKDKETLKTLRMLKASLQNEAIKIGGELDEEQELAILTREARQRRESLREFSKAERFDLVQEVEGELAVVGKYLPAQLSEDEVRKLVKREIMALGAESKADFGKVMNQIMPKVKGKADGSLVHQILKELLG